MGFRTVVVNSRCKLEFKMNYLVLRGDETKRIFLDEISMLIIHSTAVAVTTALLAELIKRNIKIVFCDEKHNPLAEVLPYFGSFNNSLKLRQQLGWKKQTKQAVWAEIIAAKITNQAKVLLWLGKEDAARKLLGYLTQIELDDITNREGHAAKVYFANLFDEKWSRNCGDFYSKALNYGYSILLSAFNREIVKNGLLTQLGIWHENQFNDFNFGCDLMESFRPLVDRLVLGLEKDDPNFKSKIIAINEQKVKIDGKEMFFENAIEVYVRSVIAALNANNTGKMLNYEL